MFRDSKKISDISFIGSGISASFTILNFLDLIKNSPKLKNRISINLIDKFPEFHTGIPYGDRSGSTTLLITSLRNFLPEPELNKFILWLDANKEWLLKEFKNEGGILSEKWLAKNRVAIQNNKWKDLFIPRRFFGYYINEMVESNIRDLTNTNAIKVNYITAEVLNLSKKNNTYTITLGNNKQILSEKVILSVGSLPVNNLWKNEALIEEQNLMFVNTPYEPKLEVTLKNVNRFTKNRSHKETNVLIIGANASALEILYKLNDVSNAGDYIPNNFVFLSTQGRAPDAVIDKKRKKDFKPIHLIELQNANSLTAESIAEATFKDINLSDDIKLGAASTVDIISSAFGRLLEKLNESELEKFACFYGNEIGKKQRCAGVHYSNTIEMLKMDKRFEHIAGRFVDLEKKNNNYFLKYLDTNTGETKTYNKEFNLIFNCIGGKNLTQNDVPKLILNLIENGYCKPNKSKIGFHVNHNFEASSNLHVMGPLLAGNVIDNKAVWHVEHCGRIISISQILAKNIHNYFLEKDNNVEISQTKINCKEKESKKAYFEAITNKTDWDAFLNNIESYDFYHTYDYHKLSASETETPILLKYVNKEVQIGLPLLIRNIPNSDYKDATSVYGYVGPISKGVNASFDNFKFSKGITNYFNNNNIISVFSRLNPYIEFQHAILKNFGEIVPQGKVVNIDLSLDLDSQRKNYRNRLKTHINKARRLCTVKASSSHKDLQKFIELYNENMDRVNAKKYYYFSKAYFENILKSNDFETTILSVIDNESGEVIGASMFIATNSILQYHLSGSKNEYLHLMPTKLLIDEMRIIAKEKGCFNAFNLGGGLGGRDDDSLFHFKSSFSKDFKQFNLWKFVVNQEIYDELVEIHKVNANTDYFPNYRSNEII
ncbi:peptidoglycan bridge formation glycyltransferase FemA/FemB family protein [Hwangdonia lutea]|uniref:Peptidoglycan bridge formation glycyltransferase FemA/FemB family protein n=1 Tax=Hwangdonia lutea TaxID=3075823 RepID=A0AA97ELK0_9FLAO|nr:peptidoglycan bridge formation glycyltransferase FemA/FemB family protein [Hwangdonia sp. SCSIO 19198]WOD43372.1 peptidoglycan bridge formation glycyltransferase FemA/FemB family protein [Hwangdonia sp. SCSIO 19198]